MYISPLIIVAVVAVLNSACVSYDRAACLTISHNVGSFDLSRGYKHKESTWRQALTQCRKNLEKDNGKPASLNAGILEVEECLGKRGWGLTQDLRVKKRLC